MPHYLFFAKDKQIAVLESSDKSGTLQLITQGFEKQYEEIDAVDAERALARFADIRSEEVKTAQAFVTGSAFSAILTAFFK
ncbi:hypothetical protein ACRQ84_19280 (plasmid) [Enterobacter ludwigii]